MAETSMGSSSQLAWVKETTWGVTPATPAMKIVPLVSESLKVNIPAVESAEIRPDRHFAQPIQGNIAPAGDVMVEWNANALAYFLYYLCGEAPVTTGAAAPYHHVFHPTHSVDLPSVTLEKGYKDIVQYYKYPGGRINTVSFAVAPGAIVTGTINWMLKNEVHSSTPLDAAATDIAHIPFDSFHASITEAGVIMATSTKFDITFENQLVGLNVIGSQYLGALLAQRFKTSGSMELFFTNNDMYLKHRDFVDTAIVLLLTDTLAQFISADIKSARYTGDTPVIPGEGPVLLTLPFSSYHDAVSGEQVEFIVECDQASLIV
jgi:hypothetical protein